MPKFFLIIITIFLSGCFGNSTTQKIEQHFRESSPVLEFGWKFLEIKVVTGKYYAYLSLPPGENLAIHLESEYEHTVQGMCPAGINDSIGKFWQKINDIDKFRLIVKTNKGDVIANVLCDREFNRLEHLLKS